MNISDLVRGHPEQRRVGVRFDDRLRVVSSAKRLYVELGIACELEGDSICLLVPRVAATWYLGLLERSTGRVGFNEWDR